MKRIYLDTNIIDRLCEDHDAAEALVAAQRHRRIQVIIGYRLILELGGAVRRDQPIDQGVRDRAALASQLILSGGRVGLDGLILSKYAILLAPSRRWMVPPTFDSAHANHHSALITLDLIAQDSNRNRTCDWYVRNIKEQQHFHEQVKAYRAQLREGLPQDVAYFPFGGAVASLDQLEAAGWLQERAASYARGFGWKRKIPRGVPLSWFGPLGRLVRAEMGLVILRSMSTPDEPRRRERKSDMSDVVHIVTAGMIRCFVTDDEEAAMIFRATWPERRRTCMLYRRDFARFIEAHSP